MILLEGENSLGISLRLRDNPSQLTCLACPTAPASLHRPCLPTRNPAMKLATWILCTAGSLPFLGCSAARAAEPTLAGELRLQPSMMQLRHVRQPHSILVTAASTDGLTLDLTGTASFQSGDEK